MTKSQLVGIRWGNAMMRGMAAILLLMVALPAFAAVLDNKGKDFLVAFLPNELGAATIQLHLTSDVATSVTVQYPANFPTFTTTVPVTPGNIAIVTLPVSAANGWTAGVPANNAVRAFADQEFIMYMINRAPFTSDAGLALPVDAMNTEYLVLTYAGSQIVGADRGLFSVVAGFDNTTVTITPKQALVGGFAANIPFNVVLNRGQGFLARTVSGSSLGDLTGSAISSDRPVSVTNGNLCTNVPPNMTYCDHVFEVAQPVQSWGLHALVTNLPNRTNGSRYRILASQDATSVLLDGAPLATLNRGQFFESGFLAGSHEFSADKPIFVAQFMPGSSNAGATLGDPAMGNMVPAEQYLNRYTFSTVGGGQFVQQFVSIIAKNTDVGSLLLDAVPVPAASFSAIGTTGYSSTVIRLAEGTHTTASTSPHGITVEGYNVDDSYIFPGGAQFEFINPVGDSNPPICNVASVEGVFIGSARDSRPSEDTNNNGILDPGEDLNGNGLIDVDTGIFFVELADGTVNLNLSVSPFVPGDPLVNFNISIVNPSLPAVGEVVATDGAGNKCRQQVRGGSFDPFRGIVRTPSRNLRLSLLRPSPNTEAFRCMENIPPGGNPNFTGIPFIPFSGNSAEVDLLLSAGVGIKEVCCQYRTLGGGISPAMCSTIELFDPLPAASDVGTRAKPGKVDVYWTAVSGATSYDVFRSATAGGPYDFVGTTLYTTFVDLSVTNGQTYFYVVQSVNADGRSGNSNESAVTVPVDTRRR